MRMQQKILTAATSIFSILVVIVFSLMLSGCSGGGGSSSNAPAADESIGPNGVRKDIYAYIESVYPNEPQKKAALTSYAKNLQSAYTEVTSETEAMNTEPKIINALACVTILGETGGKNSPSRIVGQKTADTPERLDAQLKYEKYLDGKIFTLPSLDSPIESVCDFQD